MELSMMQMYWLLMLDNIDYALGVVTLVIVIVVIVGGIFSPLILMDIKNPPSFRQIRNTLIGIFLVFVILVTVKAFLPSTKQMAAIIVVPKIVNNEQVQQIPDKILNLGLEWLEDLNPNKEEKE